MRLRGSVAYATAAIAAISLLLHLSVRAEALTPSSIPIHNTSQTASTASSTCASIPPAKSTASML
jgi:hypothetical protein